MHTTPVSSPAAGLAASSRSPRRGLRDMPGTPDARTRRGGDRSRRRAPVVTAAIGDRRAVYPRLPARHVILARYGPRAADALECACRSPSRLHYRNRKLERDGAGPHQPPGSQPLKQPRPYSVVTPGHRRWRSGGCGAPCRCRHRRSGRAESGTAPPCMRWRGPARPRRTGWPVVWPCRRRAPPAGARYPCERPVSRLLPRSRRRPQVVPVSSGKAFLLPTRAPRKSPAGSHFWFFRYPRRFHREQASYPHFTAVIHGIIHSLSTASGPRSRRTPGPLHRM